MGEIVDIRSIIHAGYDENGIFHPVIVRPERRAKVLCMDDEPSPPKKFMVIACAVVLSWIVILTIAGIFAFGMYEGIKWIAHLPE